MERVTKKINKPIEVLDTWTGKSKKYNSMREASDDIEASVSAIRNCIYRDGILKYRYTFKLL